MKKIFVIFVACLCTMPSVVFGEFKLPVPGLLDNNDKKSDPISNLLPKQDLKAGLDTEKMGTEVELENKKTDSMTSLLPQQDYKLETGESVQMFAKRLEFAKELKADNLKDEGDPLYKAMLSRSVDAKKLCVTDLGEDKSDPEECAYIHSDFGICDTHVYNKKLSYNSTNSDDIENVREMVATKITVISQQMYKQYEYLSSTLRRLRTQLQKAALTAELEMAGGNSEKSSSGSYSRNNDKEIVLAGAQNCWNSGDQTEAYRCIQQNVNLVKSNIQTNRKQAKDQLVKTYAAAQQWGIIACSEYKGTDQKECAKDESKVCDEKNLSDANSITQCANALSISVARAISAEQEKIMQYTGNRRY